MTMLGALAVTQRRGTGPPGSGDVARQASMGTVSYSAAPRPELAGSGDLASQANVGTVSYSAAPGPGLAGSGDLASEASMSLTGQP